MRGLANSANYPGRNWWVLPLAGSPSLPWSPNVKMQLEIALKSNVYIPTFVISVECIEIMALIGKWCGRRLSCIFRGVISYFWNMDTLWKGAFKTDMSEKCFRGDKDLSPPLRSQLHLHIHLVHCHVNVPANSTPLCRLSRQDTFILLWMDRITHSRPLCCRGEEDQTWNYCKADLGPFNCLSQTQRSQLDFSLLRWNNFLGPALWCIIMSEFQLSSQPSLGRLPWQQSNRPLVNVSICVCVWRRLAVSLFASMPVNLYAYVLVCLREWGKACRGNLLICWPISIYMKTNYSWGWGKCLAPEQKTKEMQSNASQWKGRIEWMSAEMQRSGSSEGMRAMIRLIVSF